MLSCKGLKWKWAKGRALKEAIMKPKSLMQKQINGSLVDLRIQQLDLSEASHFRERKKLWPRACPRSALNTPDDVNAGGLTSWSWSGNRKFELTGWMLGDRIMVQEFFSRRLFRYPMTCMPLDCRTRKGVSNLVNLFVQRTAQMALWQTIGKLLVSQKQKNKQTEKALLHRKWEYEDGWLGCPLMPETLLN